MITGTLFQKLCDNRASLGINWFYSVGSSFLPEAPSSQLLEVALGYYSTREAIFQMKFEVYFFTMYFNILMQVSLV